MGLTSKENLDNICCRVFEIRTFFWKLCYQIDDFPQITLVSRVYRSSEERRYRKWLEFRDFYTKGRGTDCKAAVRALIGVIIVLLVIETHHFKEEEEEEEEEEERDRKPLTKSRWPGLRPVPIGKVQSAIPLISFVFFSKSGNQLLPTTSYNVFRI